MKVLPLHDEITEYLKKHSLDKKFNKQKRLFENNLRHTSLETELLEPKHLRIYSFRVDKKYRAIFIFHNKYAVEIIDVNNHYK
jgi:plasmid maintenance system killer protein